MADAEPECHEGNGPGQGRHQQSAVPDGAATRAFPATSLGPLFVSGLARWPSRMGGAGTRSRSLSRLNQGLEGLQIAGNVLGGQFTVGSKRGQELFTVYSPGFWAPVEEARVCRALVNDLQERAFHHSASGFNVRN